MAWTIVKDTKSHGNDKVVLLDVTTDSATFAIETGLSVINCFNLGNVSMTTQIGYKIAANSGCSGVAAFGTLGCTGFSAGDRIFITVYGK